MLYLFKHDKSIMFKFIGVIWALIICDRRHICIKMSYKSFNRVIIEIIEPNKNTQNHQIRVNYLIAN